MTGCIAGMASAAPSRADAFPRILSNERERLSNPSSRSAVCSKRWAPRLLLLIESSRSILFQREEAYSSRT